MVSGGIGPQKWTIGPSTRAEIEKYPPSHVVRGFKDVAIKGRSMSARTIDTLRMTILLVTMSLLLQPFLGAISIDSDSGTTSELADSPEIDWTGARGAQTEWVASAVQSNSANTQNPNLVFPSSIFVDSNDNIIAVGSLVADITFGTVGVSSQNQMGFIALANSQGVWQWVESLTDYSGGGFSGVTDITQVGSDYYICGWYQGNVSFGNQNQRSTADSQDFFVSKINSQGVFDWTTTGGGGLTDTCESITSSSSGDVFAGGSFNTSANFETISKVTQGGFDAWFAKINTGQVVTNRWSWVTTAGGSLDDYGACIETDGTSVYGCGWFSGTATFGTSQMQAIGQYDSFITKLTSSGGFSNTAQAGASGGLVQIFDMIEDGGIVYATGHLVGTANFDAHQASSSNNGQDRSVFVAALGSNSQWSWATAAVGSYQTASGIAKTGGGALVISGTFASSSGGILIQSGTGQFGSTTLSSTYMDGFIAGMSTSGAWAWAEATDGDYNDEANGVGVTSTGMIVSLGEFGAGGVQEGQSYSITLGTSSVSGTGNYYTENAYYQVGLWMWAIGADSDGDGVADSSDNCPQIANPNQEDIDGDNTGDVCDPDIDGDNLLNDMDNCDGPTVNWDSGDISLDMDQDGCHDASEDDDDDGDGVDDVDDGCSGTSFKQQWSSNSASDHDSDGCHDTDEDDDDDNDGIDDDMGDMCLRGLANWGIRNGAADYSHDATRDHDVDGCEDESEDDDDDNDGIDDDDDRCKDGETGWASIPSVDGDADGCKDATEDDDDDNDGILDGDDACSPGAMGWLSSNTTDLDGDGCRDLDEDDDDDGDGIADSNDACPNGATGWISSSATDIDGDGCRDLDEDDDDDGDGFLDEDDDCPQGETGWFSNEINDVDRDGCRDSDEDTDDDNDSVHDDYDECPNTPEDEPVDIAGCGWYTQQDSDNDGVTDDHDNCPGTPSQLIRDTFAAEFGSEVDEIGCWPGEINSDGDEYLLYQDDCPNTPSQYIDQVWVDGCHASEYDTDNDGFTGDEIYPMGLDACPGTSSVTIRQSNTEFGTVQSGCWEGDADDSSLTAMALLPSSDDDGVLAYADQCWETAAGAIVPTEGEWAGCGPSQRDEDGDGVMTDKDHIDCRDTPSGVEVRTDGEYAGCTLDQRAELGDTSAILQQNIIWIILAIVVLLGLILTITLVALRGRGGGDTANEDVGMADSGYATGAELDWQEAAAQPSAIAAQTQMAAAAGTQQTVADYSGLPPGGSYGTGAAGETLYNAPDGTIWQMNADQSFIRIN